MSDQKWLLPLSLTLPQPHHDAFHQHSVGLRHPALLIIVVDSL
ncbi:hypothetical protein [Micromonospora psammae]